MHGRGVCTAREHAWQGACMAGGMCDRGMCGRGHAWQGACMAGGMHGRGHVWQGACVAGGMHGRGHAWQGSMCCRGHVWEEACVAGGHAWHTGPPGRYDKIWSMSGRYASYWNAFFNWFLLFFTGAKVKSLLDIFVYDASVPIWLILSLLLLNPS